VPCRSLAAGVPDGSRAHDPPRCRVIEKSLTSRRCSAGDTRPFELEDFLYRGGEESLKKVEVNLDL